MVTNYKLSPHITLHLKQKPSVMNRRHLLKGMGVVALYSSFPAILSEFISSCNSNDKISRAGFFSETEFDLLGQVCDIILPRTSTPGALDIQLPHFIEKVVKDCMSKDDGQLIKKGLNDLSTANGKTFSSLAEGEKKQLIKTTDENAFKDDPSTAWFRIIKKLALIGYFTSQEGMTKALRYVKVPGDYKACIPYKKGDKAMAKTFLMYW
jgi:hypothetical protein